MHLIRAGEGVYNTEAIPCAGEASAYRRCYMTPEQKIYPGTQREAVIGTQGVSPGEVVAAALTAIQPDGTVRAYDADTDEWTAIAPAAPKPLDCLPADQYYDELFNLRRTIAETILGIVDHPEQTDRQITQLAHHLTAYRHDPAFIEYTTSFLTVDERGVLHWREFPQGLPWNWVPPVRAELDARNRIIAAAHSPT